MSEAQEIIAKNYENLCNDIGLEWDTPMGSHHINIEFNKKVYESVRGIVYEMLYDYSTVKDAGLEDHELEKLKSDYKPNKYEIEYNRLEILNKIMKVYLIDDRQLDYQEPTMPASGKYLSDEEFIEIAEHEGTVYSLEGFQKHWNSNELFKQYGEELEQHWIRIL